jgi:hypothetical protein
VDFLRVRPLVGMGADEAALMKTGCEPEAIFMAIRRDVAAANYLLSPFNRPLAVSR